MHLFLLLRGEDDNIHVGHLHVIHGVNVRRMSWRKLDSPEETYQSLLGLFPFLA